MCINFMQIWENNYKVGKKGRKYFKEGVNV